MITTYRAQGCKTLSLRLWSTAQDGDLKRQNYFLTTDVILNTILQPPHIQLCYDFTRMSHNCSESKRSRKKLLSPNTATVHGEYFSNSYFKTQPRHPYIKLGRAEKLEQARAMACKQKSVYTWIDTFEKFLKENKISSDSQIFTCDESGFNEIAPAVIFPGVNFNPEYAIGFPKNYYLDGWMETAQFFRWLSTVQSESIVLCTYSCEFRVCGRYRLLELLTILVIYIGRTLLKILIAITFRLYCNHFVKSIPPLRSAVLLVDGHVSHIDYHTSQFCQQNQILLFRLPPHTYHALQPTDRGFFSVFKHNLSKQAFDQSCRNDVVKSSFRATGIWPVNRLNVDHDLFRHANVYLDAELDLEITPGKNDATLPSEPSFGSACGIIHRG
ncbi:uncharacterized protein LOC130648465 [Hydractinia symbiolongicarpus]|uniref:uncharacterized protein LOC130648465 n=1 Tax=Hydractinia symbiolongicarpus TaxID=13093 RepID=UPI00254E7BFA|nr:uncharacterized protein LOC130648465 [Hydractinia symbiolongicarpus]